MLLISVISQSLIAKSAAPLANTLPSGLKARQRSESSCPDKVAKYSPLATFHSLMFLSLPPVAKISPLGLKVTLLNQLGSPCKVARHLPLLTFHNCVIRSVLTVAKVSKLGLRAIAFVKLGYIDRFLKSEPAKLNLSVLTNKVAAFPPT